MKSRKTGKDDLLTKLKSKESRIKQVLVQLEQSVDDVSHCGKKIREQEDEIKQLTPNPFEKYNEQNPTGTIVETEIKAINFV